MSDGSEFKELEKDRPNGWPGYQQDAHLSIHVVIFSICDFSLIF